jgi:hypothetical protein
MKKLGINLIILLGILLVMNLIISYLMERLFYEQTHGDDYVTIEVLEKTKAEVIILGSSRASHHFISDSIECRTNLSVYNGGRDNMGIHYINAVIPEILSRYTPKYIVLDIIPNAYCVGYHNKQSYIHIQSSTLLPFANKHPRIYNCVKKIAPMEVIKSKWIKIYPYNSLIGSALQNTFTHFGHSQYKGYEPLISELDTIRYNKPFENDSALSEIIDSTATQLLEETIQLCQQKNVKVLICFSPFYFKRPTKFVIDDYFKSLSNKNSIPILDLTKDNRFQKNYKLFYDEMHLNDDGAIILSGEISKLIR